MKYSQLVFAIVFLFGFSQALCQEDVVFSDSEIVGGFGAIYYQPLNIKNTNTTLVGIAGGVNFYEFSFGAFLSTTGENWPWQDADPQHDISLTYGGMWVGYINNSHSLIHPYGNLRLGLGESKLRGYQLDGHDDTLEESIDVIQPEIGIELNVTNFLRFNLGFSYSWVNGFKNTPDYANSDFGGFHHNITVKVGRF